MGSHAHNPVVARKDLPGPSENTSAYGSPGDQAGIGAIAPGMQKPVLTGGASTPKPGTVTPRRTNLYAKAKKAREQEQHGAGSDATPTSQVSHGLGPDEAGSANAPTS